MRLCDRLYRDPARSPCAGLCRCLFQLGPIERRIYEVARSTCEGDGLDIDLATFRLQIGYQNPLSNFKAALKQIVATDSIPDYHLELVEETAGKGPVADATPRRGRRAPQARVLISPRPHSPALQTLNDATAGRSGAEPDSSDRSSVESDSDVAN